jgi:hypothetical protein
LSSHKKIERGAIPHRTTFQGKNQRSNCIFNEFKHFNCLPKQLPFFRAVPLTFETDADGSLIICFQDFETIIFRLSYYHNAQREKKFSEMAIFFSNFIFILQNGAFLAVRRGGEVEKYGGKN